MGIKAKAAEDETKPAGDKAKTAGSEAKDTPADLLLVPSALGSSTAVWPWLRHQLLCLRQFYAAAAPEWTQQLQLGDSGYRALFADMRSCDAASMAPLVAKRLTPVLDMEPAVVSLASLPAVLASSPAGLVSSSAALALMPIGRFQFTAAGKLLVDTVQPLMHVQYTTALCDLNATVLRCRLLARLKCSSQVQPSATLEMLSESHVQLFNVEPSAFGGTLAAAVLQPAMLSAAYCANMMPGAVSRQRHSVSSSLGFFPAVLGSFQCVCMHVCMNV